MNGGSDIEMGGGGKVQRKVMIWLTAAVATASLVIVPSASAMLPAGDVGGSTSSQATLSSSSGFTVLDAWVVVGLVIAVAICCVGLASLLRNHRRLAPAH